MLAERALPGAHELVLGLALRYAPPLGRVLDLGAGSRAFTERFRALDCPPVQGMDGSTATATFLY